MNSEIRKLESAKSHVLAKAQRENRALSSEERNYVREIEDTISEIREDNPGPVTVQGLSRNRHSGGFITFGEQLQSVARAGVPGGQVDNRLHEINNAATGLNETVPSDGSFLVQKDFNNDLLSSVFAPGTLPAMCRRFPISGNSNGIKINGVDEKSRVNGSRYGGVLGYWLTEAAEITASKPKFRQVELTLKKQAALVYATDELLSDAPALEAFIREAAPAELRFRLQDAIINGTGTGQPLGIMNSGCLVTVNKESGQTTGIQAENIVKMYARHMPSQNPNLAWLVNRNVLPSLYTMSLSVGTGGAPIFQPAGGLSGKPYNTILGIPVMVVEQCQSLNTTGDIILADMSSYLLAEKGGVESAVSIHVKFIYDESVFRFVMRVDGQPALSSSITPFKGSDTVSPFVALQTRS